jgi:hypothetical protein
MYGLVIPLMPFAIASEAAQKGLTLESLVIPAFCSIIVALIGLCGHYFIATRQTRNQKPTSDEHHHQQKKQSALDKRLQTHQELYAYWWKFTDAWPDKTCMEDVRNECWLWWPDNCLYLSNDLYDGFMNHFFKYSVVDPITMPIPDELWNLESGIRKSIGMPPLRAKLNSVRVRAD